MPAAVAQRYVGLTAPYSATLRYWLRQRSSNCLSVSVLSQARWQSHMPEPAGKCAISTPHPNDFPSECISNPQSFPALTLSSRTASHNVHDTVDLEKTRPAVLKSPPDLDPKDYPQTNGKPPISDRAKHLFHIGKSYLAFYKTGFFNVWSSYKGRRALLKDIVPFSLDDAAKYGGQVRPTGCIPEIGRADYQFSVRARHDLLKLIPFSLVFAICGEFTPLVIIALGTVVVPYTCRIPKQEFKDLKKKIEREQKYLEDMANRSLQARIASDNGSQALIPDWQQEWYEAYRYNLTIFRRPIPVLGSLYHQFVLRPQLVKHCNTLLCETVLIHREGGFGKLSPRSIFEWADKYSLYALHQHLEKRFGVPPQQPHSADNSRTKPMSSPKEEPEQSITDVCNNDSAFKSSLVSACDQEAAYILGLSSTTGKEGTKPGRTLDWTSLRPECHWRTTYSTPSSTSPDAAKRRRDIEALVTQKMQENREQEGEKR